jgi:hypothetical protein
LVPSLAPTGIKMEEEDVSQRAVVSTTERRESEVGAPEQDDGDLFQQSEVSGT